MRLSHFLKNIKQDARTTRLVLAFVFVVGFLLIASFVKGIGDDSSQTIVDQETSPLESYQHPLTGEQMEVELETLPRVFGVMIDNHPDARPQSALDEAFLVYEAQVEGGITRFLAFFYEGQHVEEIGPVRSARPYFLNWSQAFDAVYVHVGGSPEALKMIRTTGIVDLDEYFNAKTFARSRARFAPHNVYTSLQDLVSWAEGQELELPVYESWMFESQPRELDAMIDQSITIDFNQGFGVEWHYDAKLGAYKRFQQGSIRPHKAKDDILVDNVIVIEAPSEVIDEVGRRAMKTNDTGGARVYHYGEEIIGTWKKDTTRSQLRVFDERGDEIALKAGTTWIEVVDAIEDALVGR